MKSVRFNRLLASSALGLVLVLGSYPGMAQQTDQQKIDAAVPLPDTTLPPPLTAKDIDSTPAQVAPADTAVDVPKQNAVAPAAEPPKADVTTTDAPKLEPTQNATAPAAEPAKTGALKIEPAKSEPKQDVAAPAAAPVQPEPVQNAATPAAEPPKSAPPAAVASFTSDQAVSDKLRELIASKQLDRVVGRKAERGGIEAFYSSRGYAPLWIANGTAGERGKSAIAYLADADSVGLDPTDYPVPNFKPDMSADALAEAELKLTASALSFAREAQIGRIHFSRVGADIQFNLVAPEPAQVLAKLAAGNDAGKALDSFNPPQPEFKALRAALADLRKNGEAPAKVEQAKPAPVHVGEGKILRPGMKDQRVIALRQRLDVAGDKNSPLYDDAVRDAVKAFQEQADLGADGNLGAKTVRALNGGGERAEQQPTRRSVASKIDTIVVNMERWRWLPRDLGNPHVIVNVPDYTLTLWDNDKVYWHTKIVVGKPGKATPMISAEMKFITVNPTWNVPPSIIENEYLPALREDPDALDRIGLKIRQDPDGTVHVYQPPGAANALGRIRFNFPNKFLVYQHDTPDKNLFARDKRAYSHGCMRVQNPLTYGEKLLSLALPKEHYTEARLEKMFGGSEININFPKPIWVHLTYQTAFVDPEGKLQFRDDVYGRDARMLAILKGSERKVADIAVEHRPDSSSKPVRMPVGMYGGEPRGNYNNGANFFDWLFNGGRPQEVYRPRGVVNPGPRASVNGRFSAR